MAKVKLTWEFPVNMEGTIDGFRLRKRTPSTGMQALADVPKVMREYTDADVTAGGTYIYRVSTFTASGELPAQDYTVVVTTPPPTVAPTSFIGITVP